MALMALSPMLQHMQPLSNTAPDRHFGLPDYSRAPAASKPPGDTSFAGTQTRVNRGRHNVSYSPSQQPTQTLSWCSCSQILTPCDSSRWAQTPYGCSCAGMGPNAMRMLMRRPLTLAQTRCRCSCGDRLRWAQTPCRCSCSNLLALLQPGAPSRGRRQLIGDLACKPRHSTRVGHR